MVITEYLFAHLMTVILHRILLDTLRVVRRPNLGQTEDLAGQILEKFAASAAIFKKFVSSTGQLSLSSCHLQNCDSNNQLHL